MYLHNLRTVISPTKVSLECCIYQLHRIAGTENLNTIEAPRYTSTLKLLDNFHLFHQMQIQLDKTSEGYQ